MYNYKLMRLKYIPIFYLMFVSGICIGSIAGLVFGLMDRSMVGLFGATFITLFAGLGSGLFGLVYTAVFNTLAPTIGGIDIKITPVPDSSTSSSHLPSPDSPLY